MKPRERTLNFIKGEPVDHPPFHPIIMRWAARYAGVNYSDFCLDYSKQCAAAVQCAEEFNIDWVTVMSDPYAEAQAFGLQVEFPENNLPLECGGRLQDMNAVGALAPYRFEEHERLLNRIRTIEEFKNCSGDAYFKVGWVEGPVAEYSDIRGLSEAAMDFYDDPDAVHHALDVIVESAIPFITAQIDAGADCIGIGEAFCSQIGPGLYREFAFERERRLVEHIHSKGALAKLHICGDTSPLIPDMIKTGANIIDIDHMVPSMAPFADLLGNEQVFSGNCDPVSVLQDGDAEAIQLRVRRSREESGDRCIISAGCEVPPDTTLENMRIFSETASR